MPRLKKTQADRDAAELAHVREQIASTKEWMETLKAREEIVIRRMRDAAVELLKASGDMTEKDIAEMIGKGK